MMEGRRSATRGEETTSHDHQRGLARPLLRRLHRRRCLSASPRPHCHHHRQHLVHPAHPEHRPHPLRPPLCRSDRVRPAAGGLHLHPRARHRPERQRHLAERLRQPRLGRRAPAPSRLRGRHHLLAIRSAGGTRIAVAPHRRHRHRAHHGVQSARRDRHHLQAHHPGLQARPRAPDPSPDAGRRRRMSTLAGHPSPASTAAPATGTTRALAAFLAALRYDDLPAAVIARAEDLFLDWLASTLAGRGARPVTALERFAARMGPADGPSEMLVSRRRTSPLFAALVNASASHVVEQDDVHNGSVFHPGAVVWPAVLATAQETGASGRDLIAAGVAGYEAGIRVGEFLGRSHYRVFHTTGTAGTLAAAAAVAHILGADAETMLHALGSAGTQASGLWEFLRDAADSKQLHTAKAASDGLLAAYLARDGLTGAARILEGAQGMAAGMSSDAEPARLTDGLGARWAILETSFKYHASCRHTHPAADALLQLLRDHSLSADQIARVRARVH